MVAHTWLAPAPAALIDCHLLWLCILVAAGVLIRRVNPTSAAGDQLQADDVLLSFDGQAIACDGTVPFRWAACHTAKPG